MQNKLLVGFVGQGYIGKNYADDFEARGYSVVRYDISKQYVENKERTAECDIVFIAVPTPTTPDGFDDHIVMESIKLISSGKIAVIKSTVIPGTTNTMQDFRPDIVILNSPEFLSEATASYDASHPAQNIIGMPLDTIHPRQIRNARSVFSFGVSAESARRKWRGDSSSVRFRSEPPRAPRVRDWLHHEFLIK